MKKILTRSPEEYKKALQLFAISGLPFFKNKTVEEFAEVYKWEQGISVDISNRYIIAFIGGWGTSLPSMIQRSWESWLRNS